MLVPMLYKNRRFAGFTLVEVLVAIVILMIGLLGLFQTINVSLNANMENQLRQAAISIADRIVTDQKKQEFASLTAGTTAGTESVIINSASKTFNTQVNITDFSAAQLTKQISVRVTWKYKARDFEYYTTTALKKP